MLDTPETLNLACNDKEESMTFGKQMYQTFKDQTIFSIPVFPTDVRIFNINVYITLKQR